jgi:hypothetical protein
VKRTVHVVAVLGAIAVTGCGKKGPPLAPLVRVPGPVATIEARRLGSEVYVSLTIPAANVDGSIPASVAAVEVYGYTGRTPPPPGRWTAVATRVARVEVPPSLLPVTAGRRTPPKTPAGPPPIALEPGGRITVVDTLTPDDLVQGRIAEPEPRERRALPLTPVEAPTQPTQPLPLRRFYVAYAFSARGTPGPTGTPAEFVLHPMPAPPTDLDASYTETGVSLTWQPSGGLIGFLLERVLPDEPAIEDLDAPEPPIPAPGAAAPVVVDLPPPTRYLVYKELAPDPFAPPVPRAKPTVPPATLEDERSWNARVPVPQTPVPVPALTFADALVLFERGRCYSVRSVRGVTELAVGEASRPFCFTPVDVFPPAPPRQLAAVASEGAISLIWEPSAEPDIGGYVVLRGNGSDDTLRPLTATPILEARYRDASTTPGARYVYAVIAVDNRLPVPNWSDESNRVEETAR